MVLRRPAELVGGFFVCIVLVLVADVAADEAGQADWHHDINSAWKQARQLERPILIYVASNTCTYCRKMEQGTLDDPEVKKQVQDRFVGVAINGSNQPKVARSLRVRAYPTTLVYGHDGRLITSRRGYVGPREFQNLLQSVQGD